MIRCPVQCKHLAAAIAAIVLGLASAACMVPGLRLPIGQPQSTATPTPLPSLTATPTPRPSLTPSPTSTFTPTVTPSPTITPTLVPMTLPKGPDVIYTGKNTEMKIFWQAESAQEFTLDVGASDPHSAEPSYNIASAVVGPADAKRFLFSAVIGSLSPGTRYAYRLVQGQNATSGSFVTAPDDAATRLKFTAYGDTRTNPSAHNAVAGQVVDLFTADPEYQTLNLMLGDLVDDGDKEAAWNEEFFDPNLGSIRAMLANLAVMPVRGNHEESAVRFSRYFPMRFAGKGRYLAFDYGPAHFILLDQYSDIQPGSAQYEWLASDLTATQKKWKFVALHSPGWAARDRHDNFVRETLQPLLEQYGVAALLAGHEHYYARAEVNGVQHLTIGTGGAPLAGINLDQPYVVAAYQGTGFARFEIDGDLLTGWFIDSSGQVQDTFTIKR